MIQSSEEMVYKAALPPRRRVSMTRADDLIDRRRLRRKLTFWRVAAVVIALCAIGAAGFAMFGRGGIASDHIARVRIEGTITENDELLERLERVRKSAAVKGVILTIDSPGGTTAGGEALYEEVRLLTQAKPVVAQVGTLATSAGYMIASATDQIVARQSSIVGSIGVLVQFPDITGLMEKVGVKLEEIKSSPLKAEPNPFSPTTDEERAMVRRLITDSYDWFVALVGERRGMTREEVLPLADGSIFTGRQALANRLVDRLGGEREAKAWLVEKGLSDRLEIIEWKARRSGNIFLPAALSRYFGGTGQAEAFAKALGIERIFLDGLLSVWQPKPLGALD
jgi:protease-4